MASFASFGRYAVASRAAATSIWALHLGHLAFFLVNSGGNLSRAPHARQIREAEGKIGALCLAPGEGLYFSPPYFNFNVYYPLSATQPLLLEDPFPSNYPLPTPQ